MNKYFLGILVFLLVGPALAVEVDQPVPDCPVQSLAGGDQALNLGAYRGKVVMVDFWATWCPPCAQAMPFFNGLRNELNAKGFEIVAINVDEDTNAVNPFLANHPVDYPIVMDPKGQCPEAFGVQAMPSTYMVDKTGKVRFIHFGYRDSDQAEIKKQVLELLAQ